MEIDEIPAALLKELDGQPQPHEFVRICDRALVKVKEEIDSSELLIWFWTADPALFFSEGSERHHDVSIGCGAPPTGATVSNPANEYLPRGPVWIGYFGQPDPSIEDSDRIFVMEKIMEKLNPILQANNFEVMTSVRV